MQASVVVVGAGIAGVSTAFHLAERGVEDVVICDPRPPLTLTSDKSTECYRNWWPSAAMVQIMNRSIDLLDLYDRRSGGFFNLNRRGYLYVTSDPEQLAALRADGLRAQNHGAGQLRDHDGASDYRPHDAAGVRSIDGADVLDRTGLERQFPYLSSDSIGAVHARRAGWMSAQQLGAWMLGEARDRGVRLVPEHVVEVSTSRSAVTGVVLGDSSHIAAPTVVNAAGPMLDRVASTTGVELPVHSEAHFKVAFRDLVSAVPREAPMLIWCDPQTLGWSMEERGLLEEAGRSELAGVLPGFCHGRPEGAGDSQWLVALWEYDRTVMEPQWPMPTDDLYPEVVMRGMSTMLPALGVYLDHLPQPFVDGGFYTKAPDNMPLIGPSGPAGSIVCGAMSGFGVMVAAAAGELAALHAAGGPLPEYAAAFRPGRFDEPEYVASMDGADAGQL